MLIFLLYVLTPLYLKLKVSLILKMLYINIGWEGFVLSNYFWFVDSKTITYKLFFKVLPSHQIENWPIKLEISQSKNPSKWNDCRMQNQIRKPLIFSHIIGYTIFLSIISLDPFKNSLPTKYSKINKTN